MWSRVTLRCALEKGRTRRRLAAGGGRTLSAHSYDFQRSLQQPREFAGFDSGAGQRRIFHLDRTCALSAVMLIAILQTHGRTSFQRIRLMLSSDLDARTVSKLTPVVKLSFRTKSRRKAGKGPNKTASYRRCRNARAKASHCAKPSPGPARG